MRLLPCLGFRSIGWLLALSTSLVVTRPAHAGLLFVDDFESGTGAWTLKGGWGTTTTGPHSVTQSLTDTPGYNYSSNASTTATKITAFDLKNAAWPRFWFWLRYSSEQFHDYLHVETSINGTNWIEQNVFSGSQVDWKLFEVSLKGYAGQSTVYVRFRVETNATINDDGWYIDDFVFDDGNPAITISSPSSGTVWAANSDQTISFSYDGSYSPLASSMTVSYSDDGFVYYTLGSKLPITTTSWPWTVPNLNIAKAYVRVELFDQYDTSLSQTTTPPFGIDSMNPGTFTLTSPADAACGSSTPTFDWGDSTDTNGVKYTLTVTPTTGTTLTKTALGPSQYTVAAGEALADAGNPYAWSVTATDPVGHTRKSASRTYSTDTSSPSAFALNAPADQSMSDGTGLTFAWDAASDVGCAGLSKYVLYIDSKVCADNLAPATTSIALAATKCSALSFGAHSWTVAAVDAFGNVGWSSASPGGIGGWDFSIIDNTPDPGNGAGGDAGAAGGSGAPGTAGTVGSGGTQTSGDAGAPTSTGGALPGAAGQADDMMPDTAGQPGMSNGGTVEQPTGGSGPASRGGTAGATSGGKGSRGGTKGTQPSTSTGGEGSDNPTATAPGSGEDGGCGCEVAGDTTRSSVSAAVALLAALALRWRRRRAR